MRLFVQAGHELRAWLGRFWKALEMDRSNLPLVLGLAREFATVFCCPMRLRCQRWAGQRWFKGAIHSALCAAVHARVSHLRNKSEVQLHVPGQIGYMRSVAVVWSLVSILHGLGSPDWSLKWPARDPWLASSSFESGDCWCGPSRSVSVVSRDLNLVTAGSDGLHAVRGCGLVASGIVSDGLFGLRAVVDGGRWRDLRCLGWVAHGRDRARIL